MTILVGALAANFLRRELADPEQLTIFRAVVAEVETVSENNLYYLDRGEGHDYCSISVLAHDDTLDAYPKNSIMLNGLLERTRAGIEIAETYISFGDNMSEAIKQRILSGEYVGKPLSAVIGTAFGDCDPILGEPYAREMFGENQVVMEFPATYAEYPKLSLALEALTSSEPS